MNGLLVVAALLAWWGSVEWRVMRGRQAPMREPTGE